MFDVTPLRFEKDDIAWLIVGGDPKKGANCHKVKIVEPAGEDVIDPTHPDKEKVPGITVEREAWTDTENLDSYEEYDTDHVPKDYESMTFSGLILDVEVRVS